MKQFSPLKRPTGAVHSVHLRTETGRHENKDLRSGWVTVRRQRPGFCLRAATRPHGMMGVEQTTWVLMEQFFMNIVSAVDS